MPSPTPPKTGTFISNVTKLSSARFIALGLGLVTAPIFGRLFTPEQVGIFAVFVSVITLITTFGTMRYELAVVLPETDEDAINVWGAGALILSAWIGLLVLAVVFGVGRLLEKTNYASIIPYMWLVPVGVLLANLSILINQWLNRKKRFGVNAISSIAASITNQFGAIGAGSFGYNSAATLIAVNLFSQVLGLLVKTRLFLQQTASLRNKVNMASILAMMKLYKKFPFVELWSATLNTLSTQLAPLLLVFYYSPDIVGLYAQGMRLIQLPMVLVGQAINQVFYQQAVEAKLEGCLPEMINKVMGGLVLVGGFPFLVLGLYGDTIFSVLLGGRWAESGVYTQILAAWIFVVFCGSPISSAYLVLDRQGTLLLFNIATILLRSLALVIGGLNGGPRLALSLYSIVGVVLWLILISNLFSLVRLPILKTWLNHLSSLIPALLTLVPLLLARLLIGTDILRIVAVLCISFVYLSYMIFRHPLYRSSFNMFRSRSS